MLKIVLSTQFRIDLKLAIKRGLNLDLLNTVISVLANGHKLEAKYKDHNLTGKYKDFRECHIEPDWLLIYRIKNYELELYLFRTGSHSDLF